MAVTLNRLIGITIAILVIIGGVYFNFPEDRFSDDAESGFGLIFILAFVVGYVAYHLIFK